MAKQRRRASEGYSGEHSALSHLFTIRVWQETADPTSVEFEWRGRLHHVLSGQICYFRSWDALISEILSILGDSDPEVSAVVGLLESQPRIGRVEGTVEQDLRAGQDTEEE
jgi:hypothetical protein